jgi:hypothetical protein
MMNPLAQMFVKSESLLRQTAPKRAGLQPPRMRPFAASQKSEKS